ncbi:ankyrin repeat-containing domain protein [Xylariaceae sp. FL1019]|nr:ankyrin repeat-containing domain protein [Xylariaceae sp. FL1019]
MAERCSPFQGMMPTEMIQAITSYMSDKDFGTFLASCRTIYVACHMRFFTVNFNRMIENRTREARRRRVPDAENAVLRRLFILSVKSDSACMADQLSRRDALDLRQHATAFYPVYPVMTCMCPRELDDVNSLHLAILGDAPAVIIYLMKQGVGMSEPMEKHVDLLSLCLVLTKAHATQGELDKALRTTVTYRLPRCVKNLLVRGANPNAYNQFGLTATHYAFMPCAPLSAPSVLTRALVFLSQLNKNQPMDSIAIQQARPALATMRRTRLLKDLLTYGADLTLRTRTTRFHICDEKCWKSIDCYQGGESVSHLAAASGLWLAVRDTPTFEYGLGTFSGAGQTPLFKALCRARLPIVDEMLDLSFAMEFDRNPVVQNIDNSTALHIACRFALAPVVARLLRDGVSANVTDRQGRTPLHEALQQTTLGTDETVLETLYLLAHFGADADTNTATRLPTPRAMAKIHPIPKVREMFVLERVEKPPRLPKSWLK